MQNSPEENPEIRFRHPQLADAAGIWQLVSADGTLDSNSAYTYLLLCTDFAETCLVAEAAGKLAGFVSGYVPPRRRETLFVWQVCVSPDWRRRSIARRMLLQLMDSPACRELRWLEATVSPDNQASRRLFAAVAESWQAPLTVAPCFFSRDFPGPHEDEPLVRIGPRSI